MMPEDDELRAHTYHYNCNGQRQSSPATSVKGIEIPERKESSDPTDLVLYKSIGDEDQLIDYFTAHAPSTDKLSNDWSGMYMQFTAEHASETVAYRWDMGYTRSQLVRVTVRSPLTVVVVTGNFACDHKLSGKAGVIKEKLGIEPSVPLMAALGKRGECLCLKETDSQYEFVIPHSLLSTITFDERVITEFKPNKYGATGYQRQVSLDKDEEGGGEGIWELFGDQPTNKVMSLPPAPFLSNKTNNNTNKTYQGSDVDNSVNCSHSTGTVKEGPSASCQTAMKPTTAAIEIETEKSIVNQTNNNVGRASIVNLVMRVVVLVSTLGLLLLGSRYSLNNSSFAPTETTTTTTTTSITTFVSVASCADARTFNPTECISKYDFCVSTELNWQENQEEIDHGGKEEEEEVGPTNTAIDQAKGETTTLKRYIFAGKYRHHRRRLDYSYHKHYQMERQYAHDLIIDSLLKEQEEEEKEESDREKNSGEVKELKVAREANIRERRRYNNRCKKEDEEQRTNNDSNSSDDNAKKHWLAFTAGPMGVGKTVVVQWLSEKGLLPKECFVIIDPDNIRRLLPEYIEYVKRNASSAGFHTQKEAGYISEVLILEALTRGRHVLVEGTLHNASWYDGYFRDMRVLFPNLRIAILEVSTTNAETLLQRVERRSLKIEEGEETEDDGEDLIDAVERNVGIKEATVTKGRVVPKEAILYSAHAAPLAVQQLAHHAHFRVHFRNDAEIVINRKKSKNNDEDFTRNSDSSESAKVHGERSDSDTLIFEPVMHDMVLRHEQTHAVQWSLRLYPEEEHELEQVSENENESNRRFSCRDKTNSQNYCAYRYLFVDSRETDANDGGGYSGSDTENRRETEDRGVLTLKRCDFSTCWGDIFREVWSFSGLRISADTFNKKYEIYGISSSEEYN